MSPPRWWPADPVPPPDGSWPAVLARWCRDLWRVARYVLWQWSRGDMAAGWATIRQVPGMGKTNRWRGKISREQQLDALYAELPTIECRDGGCWQSCGPVPMTGVERQRIVDEHQVQVAAGPDGTCCALTPLLRCGVYQVRPLICRIWGMTRSLPCPSGCRPSRWLSDDEADEFIARAYDIDGQPGLAASFRARIGRPRPARRGGLLGGLG